MMGENKGHFWIQRIKNH